MAILKRVAESGEPASVKHDAEQGQGLIGPGTSSSFNSNDQADAKLDWGFSDNDNLSGRFTIARYREAPNTVVLPTFIGNNKDAPTTGGVITWIDLTAGKRFPVTEAKTLEFRAELFKCVQHDELRTAESRHQLHAMGLHQRADQPGEKHPTLPEVLLLDFSASVQKTGPAADHGLRAVSFRNRSRQKKG